MQTAGRRGSVLQFGSPSALDNQLPNNNSSPVASSSITDKQLMLELLAVLSPELTFDDTAEHLVRDSIVSYYNVFMYSNCLFHCSGSISEGGF